MDVRGRGVRQLITSGFWLAALALFFSRLAASMIVPFEALMSQEARRLEHLSEIVGRWGAGAALAVLVVYGAVVVVGLLFRRGDEPAYPGAMGVVALPAAIFLETVRYFAPDGQRLAALLVVVSVALLSRLAYAWTRVRDPLKRAALLAVALALLSFVAVALVQTAGELGGSDLRRLLDDGTRWVRLASQAIAMAACALLATATVRPARRETGGRLFLALVAAAAVAALCAIAPRVVDLSRLSLAEVLGAGGLGAGWTGLVWGTAFLLALFRLIGGDERETQAGVGLFMLGFVGCAPADSASFLVMWYAFIILSDSLCAGGSRRRTTRR